MDSSLFRSLEWRCIGPHRGGRVVAVAGHPTDMATFYFGGAAGGVWKTTNGGSHWANISDGFFKTAAVGALTVAAADPNVIYAGTGETAIRSNVSHGDGVYKSTDSGRTWANIGLAATRHIGDILVHPHDADTAYVAALGHAWGPNPDRGVYRTRDGGVTWQHILFKSDRAGSHDITMDSSNPRVLYAAIWQGQRYPHAASSGGEDSGIWRTLDGGDTWTDITRNPGLPKGILGKIGVAASPAQAGRVWALVEAEDGALFRSDDYGDTWERVCDNPDLRRRPWYYMHVYADPQDANTVWVLTLNCWKSIDGGKSFEAIPTPHGDNHGLWIDPHNSNRLIEGNDGGACVSYDGGHSWSSILNQPTAQFYHVMADDQTPYHVYGSQQDNWAMRLPSIGFEGAISWKDYVEPGGGESGYIAVSPKPPHLVFGGGIGTGAGHGRLIAWNPQTGQKRNVTVWPEVNGFGAGADQMKYRFQWTFPVEFSPHEENTLYICSNHVHRSYDEGVTWEVISPDLTRDDPEKLGSSGGPLTADNSGAEIYCTIFAFRESPREAGVFWTGSDDGLVHNSRDGGTTWTNVTPPTLPEWAMISIIEPSPHDPATAYIAATSYKLDDLHPYLYKTSDYGATWTQITQGIPDDDFTRVIREDPARRGLLYAGTETGIYLSFNDGDQWHRLDTNLPVVPIWDLIVKGTDLVAATHGRSFWILDDITPLHQMHDALTAKAAHLFAPRATVRYRMYSRAFDRKSAAYVNYMMTGPVTVGYKPTVAANGALTADFYDAGKNPPEGVIIHYWLKDAPTGPVTLSILDADGAVIRAYTPKKDASATGDTAATALIGETDTARQGATGDEEVSIEDEPSSAVSADAPWVPVAPGANRFVWDYRYAPPTKLESSIGGGGMRMMQDSAVVPRAVPGQYQVRLTVGDQTFTEPFTILPDPRLPVTLDDLRAQFTLKLAIRDRLSAVHRALNQIARVRTQVEEWEVRAKGTSNARRITDAAKTLKDQLAAVEGELTQPDADKPQPGPAKIKEKLGALSVMIDESDHAPTQGAGEVFTMLDGQLDTQQKQLQALLDEQVPGFGDLVQSLAIPPIVM